MTDLSQSCLVACGLMGVAAAGASSLIMRHDDYKSYYYENSPEHGAPLD